MPLWAGFPEIRSLLSRVLWQQFDSSSVLLWSQRLGVFGLGLWAFTAYQTLGAANVGLLLMLVAMVVQSKQVLHAFRWHAWFIWLCLFCLYVVVSALVSVSFSPEVSSTHWDATARFLKLFLFIPVIAWWLGGSSKRVAWVLGLFLAGFLLEQLIETDFRQWQAALAGQRISMGMQENHVGFYSAVVIAVLLVLAPYLWGQAVSLRLRILRSVLWVSLLIACAFLFYAGQSRAALVALLIVVPITLLIGGWPHLQQLRSGKRPIFFAIGVLGVAAILFIMMQGSVDRFREDMASINFDQLSEELKDGSKASEVNTTKVRLALWIYGVGKWSERPLMGWGPGSSRVLLDNSSNEWVKRFADCHNMTIEFLIRFGLFGSAVAFAFIVTVFFSARRSLNRRALSRPVFLVGVTGLAMFFVAEQFNFWWLDPHARFFLLMFIGILIAPSLRGDRIEAPDAGHADPASGAIGPLQTRSSG